MLQAKELERVSRREGDHGFWRPMDMVTELLASKDPEKVTEPLARSLLQVDFRGKSVVDLGSNIGFYSFLAALRGAREVHALDFGKDVVEAGRRLIKHYGVSQVHFEVVDFSKQMPQRSWDLALMLDIFGNNKIRKGRVDAVLDILMRYSQKELVFNVRPVYRIEQELGVPADALDGLYPEQHLREGRLYLLEYLHARLEPEWLVTPLKAGAHELDKPAVHCLRKV